MQRSDKLLDAKYKNIPFFVRKETSDSIGQKRIIHDYPNTQSRYLEPQGKVPDKFTVDIFFSSDTWKEDYRLFKQAIENPTPGRLVLPVFGVIENVVAIPARAESNLANVGEIPLTVTFFVTIQRPSPVEIDATEEDVSSQTETLREKSRNNF